MPADLQPRPDPLVDGVRLALRAEIERIANEETEAAVARVIERVGAKLDTFALQLLSRYTIERMGAEILIRVDKRDLR